MNSKVRRGLLGLPAAFLVLTGCGSTSSAGTPAEKAVESALHDSRFSNLEGTSQVEPYGAEHLVALQLKTPMQDSDYPTDMCTAPHTGPIRSIHWIISADGNDIVAVSPGWEGGLTCFSPPPS